MALASFETLATSRGASLAAAFGALSDAFDGAFEMIFFAASIWIHLLELRFLGERSARKPKAPSMPVVRNHLVSKTMLTKMGVHHLTVTHFG